MAATTLPRARRRAPAIALLAALLAPAAHASDLVAWVPTVAGTSPPMADALARVPQGAAPGKDRAAVLWIARGETQGFAVVVQAPARDAIRRLAVDASALRCTEGPCRGSAIPAARVDAWRAVDQVVAVPSGPGNPFFRGHTHPDGPPGAGTLADPGNGSLCGAGRPWGPPPCRVPDGLVPYARCEDGSAPPCADGAPKRPNPCAEDGTGCGPGAPALTVAPGGRQQLWIEVRVPRGAAATPGGTYRGELALTAEAGGTRAARIAVEVHVWDFDVPASPAFRTGFGFNGTSQPSAFYNLEAQELFAKHKVSLARYGSTRAMGVNDGWPGDDYGATVARLRARWGVPNALQVGPFHGVTLAECKTSWTAADYLTAEAAERWIARHRLPTDGVLLYARNSDEIVSGLAEPGRVAYPWSSQRRRGDGSPGCADTCGWCTYAYLREAARAIHATRDPAVKLLSVVDPNPFLVTEADDARAQGRPALDVFVVSPSTGWANPGAIARVREGPTPSALWAYLIRVPDRYSPKWQLDYSPVSYRLGFIAQALGVSGAAVSELADGSDLGCDAGSACPGGRSRPPEDPWRDGAAKDLCNGRPGPDCATNGDSQWLYPGAQVGLGRFSAVPHLRLKFFRDGIQDYELVALLEALRGGARYRSGTCSPAFPGKSCAALVAAVGGSDWSDYSTDTHLLQRVRKAIGDAIAAEPDRPRAR